MKIYAPNQLIRAVEKIAREHPLAGELTSELPSEMLEKLIRKIDAADMADLPRLAKTITRRQGQALCVYLPQNTYHADLLKIKTVIEAKMDAGCFHVLFRQWQKYPECFDCLHLLGKYEASACRPEGFPVKQGLLKKWSAADRPLSAVARTAGDLSLYPQFLSRISAIGINNASNLARICHWYFLCSASAPQLRQEGDTLIAEVLSKHDTQHQSGILLQMLACGAADYAFLTAFPAVYKKAYALWGEPRSDLFPKKDLVNAYTWWYNYYQVAQSLHGDQRRIAFWQQFLDQCQCSRVREHEMLIMRFGRYVVTEFEVIGAVYIFRSDYYDSAVRAHMASSRTSTLKTWLYRESEYLSRETHHTRWESNQYAALIQYHVI